MSRRKRRRWHFRDPKLKNVLGGSMPSDSPRFGAPLSRELFFPCVHLQNVTLRCQLPVSFCLIQQISQPVKFRRSIFYSQIIELSLHHQTVKYEAQRKWKEEVHESKKKNLSCHYCHPMMRKIGSLRSTWIIVVGSPGARSRNYLH